MSQTTIQETVVTGREGRAAGAFGLRDKLGYLFGDFGNDFFFILVSAFLMVYYTDIFHISAAVVGLMFLIARLWDAVADVLWGRFIDTRKPGKHGKFKPWILRMSFPLVISGVLMFVKIPGMPDGFYVAYAFITYLIWGTLYSTVNIPYGSMASVITSDPVERTTLSTYRTMGGMLAGLIINVIAPLLLFVNNKADAGRFFWGAVLFGVLAISCYIACYKLSTERVTATESNENQAAFGRTMKGLASNRPLVWLLVVSLAFMICFMLVGAVNVYLFKDYFGNAKALSVAALVQSLTVLIAMPMVKPLVARFGKKEVVAAGLLLASIVYAVLYFLPHLTLTYFMVISSLGTFGYAFFNLVIWAFVTDVIDYQEYLTGVREDGTVYSIYSFARKVGQALAGGIGGFAIGFVGYNAASKVQTEGALSGIYTLGTFVPAIVLFVIFLLLVFFYPLNKQLTIRLAADLEEKRKCLKS
ncbi:glycoside-pentoside-hexuronide (GPH):cation symporter [Paenibacillus sp. P26]|nr:glycoside-pentoside-hexuronide (GPH):cation symporter [Paenibacillus sp. P26]